VNWNPANWNVAEQQAAGRHVLSYIAGGVTVAAAWGLISTHDASGITDNVTMIWEGIEQVLKGVAGLCAILVPIYTSLRAAHTASPSEQVKAVVKNLSAPEITQAANAVADPTSRAKLINAVADMPEVRAIVVPQVVATRTESPKVVNTPAEASALPLAVAPKITTS